MVQNGFKVWKSTHTHTHTHKFHRWVIIRSQWNQGDRVTIKKLSCELW